MFFVRHVTGQLMEFLPSIGHKQCQCRPPARTQPKTREYGWSGMREYAVFLLGQNLVFLFPRRCFGLFLRL